VALVLEPIEHQDLCHGWAWTIADEDALAKQVAHVALGHYRHVAKILAGTSAATPKTKAEQVAGALALLTLKPGDAPWHRDGWIFQTISWIAANKAKPGAAIRSPHIRKADKGFDGIQIELSPDGSTVTSIIVFEDKATENARRTLRKEVWPDIEALEKGLRTNELTQETTAILEAQKGITPDLRIDEAIENILWKDVRSYRISITINENYQELTARARLFKGYADKAPGDLKRRRAETICVSDLRKWMDAFAARVIQHVKALSADV
jgi:hypothetical protein